MLSSVPLAPGARVVIRDAEWLIRKVEPAENRGKLIHAIGLSEIVRDREALFLTNAEQKITVLDPAKTELVLDSSPHFSSSLLYMESQLRKTVPTDDRIYCGDKAAMDSVPYQLDPTALALRQPRQRLLIADAVGLGKTLECGILLSELIRRGHGRRILVVTVKSMLTQFQKELWSRFSIPLTRLDSAGLHHVRQEIPTNQNPFHYFDKSIISVDTLKQDNEYRVYLENAWWDAIVIDEAHNVAERGKARSQRARLARQLASRSDSLIMLSATPHDGSAKSFASLMNMLDPTAIANEDEYGPEDIRGLFIRRFKKDIKNQVRAEFKERVISQEQAAASPEEERAFELLASLHLAKFDKNKGAGQLFRTVLEKALFSSPAACRKTIENRLKKVTEDLSKEAWHDVTALNQLRDAVCEITTRKFTKFQRLVSLLQDPESTLFFSGKADDRLVIFTERIETLEFLKEQLPKALKLKKDQFTTLRGNDSDTEQQAVVEAFGQELSPLRLLIATDVASEGINLHYLSHKMVHFDVPWSLMVFQQRNGRIDRYGQTQTPYIAYMMTDSGTEKIKGDMRILELLIQKDEEAAKNIGDPSAFLGVYDVAQEELKTAEMMEQGDAESFCFEMDRNVQEEIDPMEALMQAFEEEQNKGDDESAPVTASMPSLYPDDFSFACAAARQLEIGAVMNPEERSLEVPLTPDLKYRFRNYPREIMSGRKSFLLCDQKDVIQAKIAESRRSESSWPDVQYLWELDPVVRWLADKVMSSFRRHEAPVLPLPGLAPREHIFIVAGSLPNQKGNPVIDDWFGCHILGRQFKGFLSLEDVQKKTGIGQRDLVNSSVEPALGPLNDLRATVVLMAKRHMKAKREEFNSAIEPKLQEQLARLEKLEGQHMQQLELNLGHTEKHRVDTERFETRQRETQSVFEEYKTWIRETLRTEDEPYIKIIAVLTADGE